MKKSKILIILLILSVLCLCYCVSASDMDNYLQEQNSDMSSTNDVQINGELISETHDELDDISVSHESDDDLKEVSVSEDMADEVNLDSNSEENIADGDLYEIGGEKLSQKDVPEIISVSNDGSGLSHYESDGETILTKSVNQEDSKLSASYYGAYIKSIKTRYNSGKYLKLGWNGLFYGYFKVFKGYSVYHQESMYSYGGSYKWSLEDMTPGRYTAKLISYTGKTAASAKIIIIRSQSKIKVKSFSATAGKTFYCYAYVKDKFTGRNYNGGIVKFKIAGKIYRAKLKSGVAIAKIKIPSKVKKYTCKATFLGGKNVYGKSTKFKITVKPKPKYKTVRIHTMYDKYINKYVGNYKVQTYKWKGFSINGLGIFLYKNGKLLNRYNFQSKVHHAFNGNWKWSSWSYGTQGANAYHKFSLSKGVAVGDVIVKFRVK